MKRTVAVNAAGLWIGEDHPNAELTNAEVDRLRRLHEDEGWSYALLAEKFEISKSAVAKICRYERRGQYPAAFREVPVPDSG